MTNKYKVIYSPLAIDDLREIYVYVSDVLNAKLAARKQVNAIRGAVRSLEFLPERFAVLDGETWGESKMHKLPVKNYVVFYLVDPENNIVKIVRIFYGGRDIDAALKE